MAPKTVAPLLAIVVLGCSMNPATAQVGSDGLTSEAANGSSAQAASTRSGVVLIKLEENGVTCQELFQTVAKDLHWVAGGVAAFSQTFELAGNQRRLTRDQLDDLIERFPNVFSYAGSAGAAPEYLAVNVEHLAGELSLRKSQLRRRLALAMGQPLDSLAKVDATWQSVKKPPLRIVVVIAGLNGFEEDARAVARQLHRRTLLPACVFAYPNDGPIIESAGYLRKRLLTLHQSYPDAKITLVTHSMGGLVARWVVEADRQLDTLAVEVESLGVDQLIAVCPPNHGSALAEYAPLLDGVEQVLRLAEGGRRTRRGALLRAITDGFNEAPADLAPDSLFLGKLNAQPRNAQVRYSIIAGDDGPLQGRLSLLLSEVWAQIARSVDEPPLLDQRIRSVIETSELQRGKGDGVVSLDSARLAGVDDFERLLLHHLSWSQLETDPAKEMLDAIARRLGISL